MIYNIKITKYSDLEHIIGTQNKATQIMKKLALPILAIVEKSIKKG